MNKETILKLNRGDNIALGVAAMNILSLLDGLTLTAVIAVLNRAQSMALQVTELDINNARFRAADQEWSDASAE